MIRREFANIVDWSRVAWAGPYPAITTAACPAGARRALLLLLLSHSLLLLNPLGSLTKTSDLAAPADYTDNLHVDEQ